MGASLYYYRRGVVSFLIGLLTLDRRKLSLKSLLGVIVGYCLLVILAVWLLLVNANLSNWDRDAYLVLGNEVTGDRPWQGVISRLYICDRAIPPSDIESVFQPSEQSDNFLARLPSSIAAIGYPSEVGVLLNDSLQTPHLSWYGASSSLSNISANSTSPKAEDKFKFKSGISIDRTHWLKSDRPASQLVRRLKSSQEFSIFLQVATGQTMQTGPARIVTLSEGIYAHNLLIGQEGTDLNFRLRTPITGSQPTQPEFVVPDVFDSNNYRQILITFVDQQLTFYVQNADTKYTFKFAPAISSISYLPWNIKNWSINLKTFKIDKYRVYFYLAIAIPLILLIAISIFLAIV